MSVLKMTGKIAAIAIILGFKVEIKMANADIYNLHRPNDLLQTISTKLFLLLHSNQKRIYCHWYDSSNVSS